MAKYILKKTQKKNGTYLYQVLDENGNVISKRNSGRHYVACTINGACYFGRIDLIGKGEHKRLLDYAYALQHRTEKDYNDWLARRVRDGAFNAKYEVGESRLFHDRYLDKYGKGMLAAGFTDLEEYIKWYWSEEQVTKRFQETIGIVSEYIEREHKKGVENEKGLQIAYLEE